MPNDTQNPAAPPSVTVTQDWNFILGNIPEMRWLVPGWLPAERLTLFAGRGGVGKSRVALQLAAALASGEREWLGPHGPKTSAGDEPLPVLVASWEDDTPEIARRLRRMRADPAKMGFRLAFMDLAAVGPLWDSEAGNTDAAAWVTGAALSMSAQLVILDPLAAAFAGNENDRGEVRAFVTTWDQWARDAGCAVLVVAHPPKYGSEAYSGSTDWWNAARAVWSMQRELDERDALPELQMLKSNYAPVPSPLVVETPHNAPWQVSKSNDEPLRGAMP